MVLPRLQFSTNYSSLFGSKILISSSVAQLQHSKFSGYFQYMWLNTKFKTNT
jgi:hypothetical protein